MNIRRLITICFATTVCLFSLSACHDDEDSGDINVGDVYINFSIGVSSGHTVGTRANWWPQGGEHGNNNEAAFERENELSKVTIILFRTSDGKGLNSAEDPTLEFVRCYPVSRQVTFDQASGDNWEAWYTTGDQALGEHQLRFSLSYHAIAVANVDLTDVLVEGTNKLSDLKDLQQDKIYLDGDATKPAVDCTKFVMASANNNNRINFAVITPTKKGDAYYFDLDTQGIEVERLAARVDFWSYGGEYKEQNASSVAYTAPGYVYPVYNSSDHETADRFVITHITPFNLFNENEYLFKHVVLSDKSTVSLLADEDGNFCVKDPWVDKKITSPAVWGDYQNRLSGITETELSSNAYRKSVEAMHAQVSTNHGKDGKSGGFSHSESYTVGEGIDPPSYTLGPSEDIIIAYPRENLLAHKANLYYYATGIIIEGDYYANDALPATEHRVYYGFLRHASKTLAPNAYDALLASDFDTPAKIATIVNDDLIDHEGNPNHFGVVRNSLYRIHVGKVYQRGSMKLVIEAKAWDLFHHKAIYI